VTKKTLNPAVEFIIGGGDAPSTWPNLAEVFFRLTHKIRPRGLNSAAQGSTCSLFKVTKLI